MIVGTDAPSNTASTYSGSTSEFFSHCVSCGRFSVDSRSITGN